MKDKKLWVRLSQKEIDAINEIFNETGENFSGKTWSWKTSESMAEAKKFLEWAKYYENDFGKEWVETIKGISSKIVKRYHSEMDKIYEEKKLIESLKQSGVEDVLGKEITSAKKVTDWAYEIGTTEKKQIISKEKTQSDPQEIKKEIDAIIKEKRERLIKGYSEINTVENYTEYVKDLKNWLILKYHSHYKREEINTILNSLRVNSPKISCPPKTTKYNNHLIPHL